jgi:hypothetical protein
MPGGACGAAETQHAHTTTQPVTAMRTQPCCRPAFILDLAQVRLACSMAPLRINLRIGISSRNPREGADEIPRHTSVVSTARRRVRSDSCSPAAQQDRRKIPSRADVTSVLGPCSALLLRQNLFSDVGRPVEPARNDFDDLTRPILYERELLEGVREKELS